MKQKFIKSGMNTYTATLNRDPFLSMALLVFEYLSGIDSIQQKWLLEVFIYKLLLLTIE